MATVLSNSSGRSEAQTKNHGLGLFRVWVVGFRALHSFGALRFN